jgi:hypothetical protein
MNTFQSISIILLIGLMLKVYTGARTGRTTRIVALAWTALALGGIWTILNPRLTASLAAGLGIGRGADLVFYTAIVSSLFGFYACYTHFKRMESRFTKLIRELAIQGQKLDLTMENLAKKDDDIH